MTNPRTIARLEARILERAAYCLQFEIRDPRASFITVTRVQLSPDLSSGRIYYSVLGSESDKSKAEHMLESAAGFIQRQVCRVLQMRRMPRLNWMYDASMERASEIDLLIREARERDRKINPAVDETPLEDSLPAGPAGEDVGEEDADPEDADAEDVDPEDVEDDDGVDAGEQDPASPRGA